MQKKAHLKIVLSLLALIMLTSIACTMGGVTLSKDKVVIQINVTEDQVNAMLQRSDSNLVVSSEALLKKIDSVEFNNEYIRVFGEVQTLDGTTVSGSFDISLKAEDGELKVQIIAVNVPGVDINDPRIVKANRELAKELSQSVRESNGDVLFKEASVSESGLMLTVEVPMQK